MSIIAIDAAGLVENQVVVVVVMVVGVVGIGAFEVLYPTLEFCLVP